MDPSCRIATVYLGAGVEWMRRKMPAGDVCPVRSGRARARLLLLLQYRLERERTRAGVHARGTRPSAFALSGRVTSCARSTLGGAVFYFIFSSLFILFLGGAAE